MSSSFLLNFDDDEIGRYRTLTACILGDVDFVGIALGISHSENRVLFSGFDQNHADDGRGARGTSNDSVIDILVIQCEHELSGFIYAYAEEYLIDARFGEVERRIVYAGNYGSAARTVLREGNVFTGLDGIGVIGRHDGVEVGKIKDLAGGTLRTLWTLRTLRTRGTGRTGRTRGSCWTCWTCWTSGSRGTGGACRTGWTRGALWSFRTLWSLWTLRTFRTLWSLRTFWPLRTFRTLRTFWSFGTLWTFGTLRTFRTFRTFGAF